MITITLNNHKSIIEGDPRIVNLVRKKVRIRKPGYFFTEAFRKGRWDGYINYITETRGEFYTGMVPQLLDIIKGYKEKVQLVDNRKTFKNLYEKDELGNLKFRAYQNESVKAILNNNLYGIKFQRGILNEATNAGKNLIAAGIISAFSKKRTAVFLIHNKSIFSQAVKELSALMPGEVGEVSTRKVEWNRVTVCMVQTLASRINKTPIIKRLLTTDIVIVDECHRSATDQYRKVLSKLYNATVRIGLSGSPLKHKDKTKNQEIINFYGPIVHGITNREMVDLGYSTPPKISFFMGNTERPLGLTWQQEYDRCITRNDKRNKKIWRRVQKNIDRNRLPILILVTYHEHIKQLMKHLPEDIKDKYNVATVHGKNKNRDDIVSKFNRGKIDILISSMIFKEGMNLPLIKVLTNAAGGDSEITTLQIFGRPLRKDDSKKKIYIEDFYDEGKYLRRHSKHRMIYYSNQKFRVFKYYEKTLNK